jgi:CRISPR system Cascade subunit CasC
MTTSRFLQIHTLHSYTAALLNRDDSGQAKRLQYGDASRTRISSQCLKRHWRIAKNDPFALQNIEGYEDSVRSRELVTERVIKPLYGTFSDEVIAEIEPLFQKFVYGEKGDKGKKSRQTLLLGQPELDYLASYARKIAADANDDPSAAKKAAMDWKKEANFKALALGAALPGGLTAAMFGRMVTSDPAANIEAPIHVAHAFTVHAAETEGDYFTAVDDLKRDDDDSGADTIQETELTCGLFYGYVVIDLPGLIKNCGGSKEIAKQLVHNLIHLIAEVSPGAKLGSTAPYGRADLMLIEAGDRQPRSLATAFRETIPHDIKRAVGAFENRLKAFDDAYATGEERHYTCLDGELTGLNKVPLRGLAEWAASKVAEAPEA